MKLGAMKLGALVNDVAIDLGTDNIRIYYKGTILDEPAVIAYDGYNDNIVAVGKEAYDMIDRSPETIDIIKPLSCGVITDFDMAARMITAFSPSDAESATLPSFTITVIFASHSLLS